MKAFVYYKKATSELFKAVDKVKEVKVKNNWIYIIPEDGMTMVFDTKKFKTTIYQN